ncbi:hypothetical protein DFH07DRAFT_799008, partial [Mycena maculata]
PLVAHRSSSSCVRGPHLVLSAVPLLSLSSFACTTHFPLPHHYSFRCRSEFNTSPHLRSNASLNRASDHQVIAHQFPLDALNTPLDWYWALHQSISSPVTSLYSHTSSLVHQSDGNSRIQDLGHLGLR